MRYLIGSIFLCRWIHLIAWLSNELCVVLPDPLCRRASHFPRAHGKQNESNPNARENVYSIFNLRKLGKKGIQINNTIMEMSSVGRAEAEA